MPSNHTDKYQLSQWEKSDKILMKDFNSDNLIIEGALASLAASKAEQSEVDELSSQVASALPEIPKVAMGTYQGTGTCGSQGPTVVTFPFKPKLVVLMGEGIYAVFLEGIAKAQARSGNTIAQLNVRWDDTTMSCYVTSANALGTNYGIGAGHQLNTLNTTYQYFVLG